MHRPIELTTTTPPARNSNNRSQRHRGFVLIALALAYFALSPTMQAAGQGQRNEGDVGGGNTVEGFGALSSNTTGTNNTALGSQALFFNTTGNNNTATGFDALFGNTTGNENTAAGHSALIHNANGNRNTANGVDSLTNNTAGNENTGNGFETLFNNTTGNRNTATGAAALFGNGTGSNNTATGDAALSGNATGSNNTATGFAALQANTAGNFNIALGFNAGINLTTGDNNIDIANTGVVGESGAIRIGTTGTQTATFVAGISGTAVVGDTVVVDANGQLGTLASSERFKDEIKPMDKASEAVLSLKPVTFRYKEQVDPKQVPQFGLVAEEVEKVDPDLVARDTNGKVYTVRYDAVNAMLLNEFLKQHRRVEELEAAVRQLQSTVAEQQKSARKRTMR